MPSFVSSILALPARTKGILAVTTVAVLGVAFLMLRLASAPSYETLASGLPPAQTSKVTAALDAAGIPHQRQNNRTAPALDSSPGGAPRLPLGSPGVTNRGRHEG